MQTPPETIAADGEPQRSDGVNVLDLFDPCPNRSGNRTCADVDSSKPAVPTEKSLAQRI
jgi:hypothetical protein